MVNLSEFKLTLPVLGTIGIAGIVAGIAIIFLLRRKKTISFKV